jgi:uncharacterized surface protein with fasciclin (FAS1) repeats
MYFRALAFAVILAVANAFARIGTSISSRISTSLKATILETAANSGRFSTLISAIKAAGLEQALAGPGPLTVFAPSDEAFSKLPPGTVEALLKDIPKLKNILLFHVHPGKLSPTRNGRTLDTLLIGEDNFPKQLTVKVTNWTCETYIWAGQENPAYIPEEDMNIKCDNGLLHVVDEVLLPYEGTQPPKITFIGKRDMTGMLYKLYELLG